MLTVDLDEIGGVALLHPAEPLTAEDFTAAAEKIDAHIERHGALKGLLIHSKNFPGWDSIAAFFKHLAFIRDHHRKIEKVAVVTNSPIGVFAERLMGHFVNAQVKRFKFQDLEGARRWLHNSDAAGRYRS